MALNPWGTMGNPEDLFAAAMAAKGYSYGGYARSPYDEQDPQQSWGFWGAPSGEDQNRAWNIYGDPQNDDAWRGNVLSLQQEEREAYNVVDINGQKFRRVGEVTDPWYQQNAQYHPEYGYVIPQALHEQRMRETYRGSSGSFLNRLAGAGPLLASAVFVGGAASGFFDAFAAGAVEVVPTVAAVEAAPVLAAAPEAVAPSMFEFFSGAPPMFSAEAAVAEASAVVNAPATAQLAQYVNAPTMFSSEAALAEAFGGAYFGVPAAVEGGGAAWSLPTLQTVKAAASPLLAVGKALRAAFAKSDAPAAGAARPVTPRDTSALDLVWTLGALVAVFAAFKLARG